MCWQWITHFYCNRDHSAVVIAEICLIYYGAHSTVVIIEIIEQLTELIYVFLFFLDLVHEVTLHVSSPHIDKQVYKWTHELSMVYKKHAVYLKENITRKLIHNSSHV